MKLESMQEEKKKLEEKLRQMRAKLVRSLEAGRYLGLDREIRQVQKNYQLMGRI